MNIGDIHSAQDAFLDEWPDEPFPMDGRGIVTSIYGDEFASGYILLKELKRLGVTLPVEVFYRPGELNGEQLQVIEELGLDLRTVVLADEVTGFAVKPFAVLRSSFAEVLWIDSDNAPTRDPEFLFSDPEYLAKGSLFWRDVSGVDRAFRWHPESPVWEVFRVSYNDAEEFETGQFLIHKRKCWQELGLVVHFNREREVYYNLVHGDKDTFRFAWLLMFVKRGGSVGGHNQLARFVPYGFMPFGPFHVGAPNEWHKWGGGSVMQQRDREGRVLFNHRSIDKFTLLPRSDGGLRDHEESWRVYGPAEEEFYLQHLSTLRSRLRASFPRNDGSPSGLSSEPSPRPSPSSAAAPSSSAVEPLQIVWLPQVL